MNEGIVMTARDFVVQINALIERKRYPHAASLLAEALGQYPQDSGLLYCAALLDYFTDNNDEARAGLHRLLSRDPEHFAARSLLAIVYLEGGEMAECEAVLLELLKDYPEEAHLYARYAMLMYRTLHVPKAQALAREALRLDPEDELALTACLIGDMIDGRAVDAKESLSTLMLRHPESISTAHMLITHLVSRGQYRAAKRIAIELLKLNPSSPEVLSLVVELETISHWSLLPLWPLQRWGWGASIGLWVLTLVLIKVTGQYAPQAVGPVSFALIGYCIYSWIYPPLLKRWLKRRAGI